MEEKRYFTYKVLNLILISLIALMWLAFFLIINKTETNKDKPIDHSYNSTDGEYYLYYNLDNESDIYYRQEGTTELNSYNGVVTNGTRS